MTDRRGPVRRPHHLALAGFALACVTSAWADPQSGPLHDRLELSLGTYLYTSSTNVRADAVGGVGQGTDFNLEQAFRFDDESIFRGEAMWRIRPRHELRLMYFEINRAREASLEETIDFDGETFPVGVWARAEVDTRIVQLAYGYNFVRRDNYELGASVGVHHVRFGAGIRGRLDAGPGGEVSGSLRGSIGTDAPLPMVGVHGTWRVWSDLYLQGHAKYFNTRFDIYDGELIDVQGTLLWNFSRHVGAGLGYNYFKANVGVDDPRDFIGRIRWSYSGLQVFVRLAM